ncbi:MAG: DUF2851 family protein, partial [Actinomycetes bacterium]
MRQSTGPAQREAAVDGADREIAVCAAWREQRMPQPLRTVAGQTLEVIHRGVWSNGLGPDFRDALLLFDGRELRA